MPALILGGGLHLGAPCRSALFGRVQWMGEVGINIQKASEYHEGGNQVCPKSSSLQGMKIQLLQFSLLGRWRMPAANPCSQSLNSLLVFEIYQEVWQTGWHTIFGRPKDPSKGMKANCGRSWRELLVIKVYHLALFVASLHSSFGDNVPPWWRLAACLIHNSCILPILTRNRNEHNLNGD